MRGTGHGRCWGWSPRRRWPRRASRSRRSARCRRARPPARCTGTVVNDTDRASARAGRRADHPPRHERRRSIGRTPVDVAAHGSAVYRVAVKLPASLKRGNYYLSACTAYGIGAGKLGCATAQRRGADQGRHPGPRHRAAAARPRPRRPPSLQRRWPHAGQAGLARCTRRRATRGYKSVHTDVHLVYDAPSNLFLDGHARRPAAARDAVPDRVQPRLRAHERRHEHDDARPGPDRPVGHDQRPAGDVHVQAADLPRRPERPGRSRPAGARGVELQPGQRDQPEPAGLRAGRHDAALQGVQCPANKLVITPSAPIPAGTRLQGRRQLHGPPRRPRRR